MKKNKRYVVECVWSGYRSSQARPCHRRVITKGMAERLRKIQAIVFTDGTNMSVDVREAKPRERVQEIRGYDELLGKFVQRNAEGYCYVQTLVEERKEREAKQQEVEESGRGL